MESVSVACDVSALHRAFDYALPSGTTMPEVGTVVRVELNGRRVDGWVLGQGEGTVATLRPIVKVKGFGPPPALVELTTWVAWRFAGARSTFLRAASADRNVLALPVAPAPRRVEPTGLTLPRPADPVQLVTVGAVEDHLDLVLDCVARAAGRGSLLVAVPTLGYAERLTRRLQRAGVPASGPSPTQWAEARSGWPVVVGTRSVAFAPVPVVGGAVVLDAHDEALAEQGAPTWNAVDLLCERTRRAGASTVLVSPLATPRLRALAEATPAVGSMGPATWPATTVADRTSTDRRHGLLTEPVVDAVRAALERSDTPGSVLLVHNAKGRARLLSCRRCEALATCVECGATVAELDGALVCRACRATRPVLCASCGSLAFTIVRPGVARLAVEAAAIFQRPVDEVTASTTEPIASAIVVGTEAAIYRVRSAQLVAILDLDQSLLAPDLHAEEQTLGLVVRAGRLVGQRAAARHGVVLVQTRQPNHPVVAALEAGDVEPLLEAAAARAVRLGLPPARAMATLRGPGARAAGSALDEAVPGLVVVDVDDQMLVSAPDVETLCDALVTIDRSAAKVIVGVGPGGLRDPAR